MKLSDSKIPATVFSVIIDEKEIAEKVIALYNAAYATDFKLVGYVEDEVTFAKITTSEVSVAHVFGLGYQMSERKHYLAAKSKS